MLKMDWALLRLAL